MQRTPRSWLPEGALDRPAVDRALGDAARQWSSKWFARAQTCPLAALTPLPPRAGAAEWIVLDDGLAIAVLPGTRIALARMMLDASPDAAVATDADRRVVADLSSACIDDLCRRVAQAFRLPADAAWRTSDATTPPDVLAARGYPIGTDMRAPLLRVVVADDLLVAAIKAGLPPPPRYGPLPPRITGLAVQAIALSALVGRCRLSLFDFAGLAVGDVLVLDRAVDAPLDLYLAGGTAPVGTSTVAHAGDRLDLTILEPPAR